MDKVEKEVVGVLAGVLGQGIAAGLTSASPLLGSVAELDSMAVVAILGGLEERFGFSVADDDVDGQTFASVASLVEFVRGKLEA